MSLWISVCPHGCILYAQVHLLWSASWSGVWQKGWHLTVTLLWMALMGRKLWTSINAMLTEYRWHVPSQSWQESFRCVSILCVRRTAFSEVMSKPFRAYFTSFPSLTLSFYILRFCRVWWGLASWSPTSLSPSFVATPQDRHATCVSPSSSTCLESHRLASLAPSPSFMWVC